MSLHPTLAATNVEYVQIAEMQLFGVSYGAEPLNSRLSRIENNIFGSPCNVSELQRVERIKKTLGIPEIPNKPIPANKPVSVPSKSVPVVKKAAVKVSAKSKTPPEKTINQTSQESYPTVSKLEKTLFNKTYEQENIYKRLDRLEMSLYQSTSKQSLSERVDNLQDTIMGDVNKNKVIKTDSDDSISGKNISEALDILEQRVFSNTFPNQNTESRIEQLENKIFSSASPEDEIDERLERLAAVIDAQPSTQQYQDMSKLRQYQDITTGIGAATLLYMVIQALAH